jgi:heme a synthase
MNIFAWYFSSAAVRLFVGQGRPYMSGMATTFATAASVKTQPRAIANWLFFVAGLVFLMVVVGGITRLTESGLSITEWKPISGAIPPLSEAAWLAEFEKYKQIPEYAEVNLGMTMAQFKFIYFWEYIHRLLGRVIGLAFALPFAWFALRRAIPSGYAGRLTALLALGAFQGVLGWWMVQSGLSQRTDVSHFRLAAHLCTALFILAGLIWTALDLRRGRSSPTTLTSAVFAVLGFQLVFGAFVAGMDAGKVSNSWPLMNGQLVPDPLDANTSPLWNLFNDPFILHFIHRWWAVVALVALVLLAGAVKRAGDRRASIAIHATLGLQILLGVATVFSGVNIVLATLHQAVGALLVASASWGAHSVGRKQA